MSSKTKKRLILKQCMVPAGSNISLETVVAEIEKKFPNHKDRTFENGLFRSQALSYIKTPENGSPGKFIGFCLQDEGATGIVDKSSSENTIGIEEFSAPDDRAWLESETILYVVGNHIIACNIGNNENAVGVILSDLAKSGDILADTKHLIFSDVPNKLTIERVKKIGVRRIDLNISSYLASLDYVEPVGKIGKVLNSIFAQPLSADEYTKRAEATGRIYLSRGGKFKKQEIPKDEWLTKIGSNIIGENFDDYTITLEDGNQISTSTLRVTKTVSLNKHGNTFSREHAHLELLNYYRELESSGSLNW